MLTDLRSIMFSEFNDTRSVPYLMPDCLGSFLLRNSSTSSDAANSTSRSIAPRVSKQIWCIAYSHRLALNIVLGAYYYKYYNKLL